ncbi:MAG: tetratricopeptide repeat protein [Bacteroidia bacterium]|nr:tetratricopeptide repeat protein [Bacteroidia bacterium]
MKIIFLSILLFLSVVVIYGQTHDSHFEQGIKHVNNNKYDLGLAEFEEAYSLDPESCEAYNNICYTLYLKNMLEESSKKIELGIARFPNHFNFYRLKGMIYYDKREYKNAIKLFTKAINKKPNLEDLYLRRAQSYIEFKKIKKGYKDAKKALKINNQSFKALKFLRYYAGELRKIEEVIFYEAKYYRLSVEKKKYSNISSYLDCEIGQLAVLMSGETLKEYEKSIGKKLFERHAYGEFHKQDELISELRKSIINYPNSSFIHRVYIFHLIITNALNNDINILDKALSLNPNLYTIMMQKAMILLSQAEFDECYLLLDKVLSINRNYHFAYVIRADIKAKRGQFDSALLDYAKAISLHPNSSANYMGRGNMLLQKGKFEKAILDFKRKINIDSSNYLPYYGLGRCYLGLDKPDSSIYFLTKAVALKPGNISNLHYRGEAYMKLKDYKNAISDYSKCIDISSGDPPRYNALRGKAYLLNKNYSEAIKDLEIANNYKESSFITSRIGYCYYKIDFNDDKAITYFERAIYLDSNLVGSYANLGWVYYLRNDFDKSIIYSKKAIAKKEDNTTAGYNLALATLRLNKFEKSKEIYKKYAAINLKLRDEISLGAIKALDDLKERKIMESEVTYIIENILK